jgi:branched-chain amino acid transport system ATP-binding protein
MVLRGVDVEVYPGSIILLRGQNGSGKTTLINILTGNLAPERGRVEISIDQSHGSVFGFPQSWWVEAVGAHGFVPERIAGLGVGRTWQDVRLLPSMSLAGNLALALPGQVGESPLGRIVHLQKSNRDERENLNQVTKVLASLGLAGHESLSADQVSLGLAKQVAVLRTMRAGGKVIFLDEPLSGLDPAEVDAVLSHLQALVVREGIALVIVEHAFNVRRVLDIASIVWTLHDGRVRSQAPDEVREQVDRESSDGLATWLRQSAGPRGRVEEHALPSGGFLQIARRSPLPAGSLPALEVNDLVVKRGARVILGWPSPPGERRGLSVQLERGDVALLQAPNGWGKSTLAEALVNLIPRHSGTVRVNGRATSRPDEAARAGVALLRPYGTLFEHLSVRENLLLFGCHDTVTRLEKSRIVSSLSGGERQRLAWAVTLQREATVLVLDEPFLSIDTETIPILLSELADAMDKAILLLAPRRREL